MRYVGVDLAWGQKGTTGLAVVDEDGTLLDIASRGSDEDILAWLSPWVGGSCLVAIDAPLIVTNPTGHRPCDRMIVRHFGRYQAYCHAVNTSHRSFADGSRALRIARALELGIDPFSSDARRMVEVYPHPAIVMLFGLPRILRYKAKPGRDLSLLRSELLVLIGLLDGLSLAEVPLYAGRHASWRSIGQAVRSATRKVEIARVEDSIDALVCAYVALYATRRPSLVRVLGDLSSGYVLTPVTPEIGRSIDAASCVFCELLASGSLLASDRDAAAFAPLPEGLLSPGHTLVVPREHCVGVLDARPKALAATIRLVQRVSHAMLTSLGASGVNVLNASGPGSGQTVDHLHFHVVPRWPDDGAEMWPSDKAVHDVPGDPHELLAAALTR